MLWNAGCPDRDRETGRQTERQTERQLKSAKRAKEKRCCGRLAVLTEGQRDRQSDRQTSLDGKTDENTQIEKENDTQKKKQAYTHILKRQKISEKCSYLCIMMKCRTIN